MPSTATRPLLTPVFRTAIRTDLPALAALDATAYPVPTWTALRFDREVRSPQQFVAVVEDDRGQPAYRSGPLAGYCVCRLDSWQIVVRRLAVAPQYRRLGGRAADGGEGEGHAAGRPPEPDSGRGR
jgi:ribosomal protein S18 acetylase RimI-like enzyme